MTTERKFRVLLAKPGLDGHDVGAKIIARVLTEAGFEQIRITPKEESRQLIREWLPETNLADYVVSATIEAVRP